MALKEVFQHSIALCDIDPQLAGVTCKQVWEALKTAYLNRHEYLDFFLDSKPLKTETVGKKGEDRPGNQTFRSKTRPDHR